MGTVMEPLPVTGLAENFSPMPRMAPPPLGSDIVGGDGRLSPATSLPAPTSRCPSDPGIPAGSCCRLLLGWSGPCTKTYSSQEGCVALRNHLARGSPLLRC